HRDLLDLVEDQWSKDLSIVLLNFGAAETKRFFTLLNSYFLESQHRLQIVYLMSEFLLRKYDNSTTLIAMSVTNLIMLLPRICTSLPPYLPQLFYIFARALCWDQLRDVRQKQGIPSGNDQPSSEPSRKAAEGWDCTGILPYSYFDENNFEVPEEFDEETFRSRTIAQVSRHMLNPSLVTMDTETELTDLSRWMKMEPPDVIAQIMSLDLTNAASRVAFSTDKNRKHVSQQDLLDESIWDDTLTSDANTPNIHIAAENESPPTLPDNQIHIVTSQPSSPEFQAKRQGRTVKNILDMHQALRSGSEVLIGDDVWVDPSGTIDTSATQPSTMTPETRLLIAALKREVLLLRNELNFELFVKQQHLQHMGRLHREHMMDSAVEAERQRTYNATRNLRAQLNQAEAMLTKLKAESALTKQRHLKWENEQSEKLRHYREARRKWQADMEEAKQKLEEYEKSFAAQAAQLLEEQKRQVFVFELENELRTNQPLLERATENEHRVIQLTNQMLLWQADTAHLEEQKKYIKGLLSQWRSMEELVDSLQKENRQLASQ
ncbi:hypothetical protein BX666DRAFT_1840699, partial [Dichotomocladium elegans]